MLGEFLSVGFVCLANLTEWLFVSRLQHWISIVFFFLGLRPGYPETRLSALLPFLRAMSRHADTPHALPAYPLLNSSFQLLDSLKIQFLRDAVTLDAFA